jgi:hypothetical protein
MDPTVLVVLTPFLIFISLSFGIASTVIGFEDVMPECASHYPGISFEFDIWLQVHGVTNLVYSGFLMVIFYLTIQHLNDSDKIDPTLLMVCPGSFFTIFLFVWSVVGAVLFVETLNKTECHASRYYEYGLSYFIIQIVFCLCSFTRSRVE